jgi:hypothetical protein
MMSCSRLAGRAGPFSSDRAIRERAQSIWRAVLAEAP